MGYVAAPQAPAYGQPAYPQENAYTPQPPQQQIPPQQSYNAGYAAAAAPSSYYDPFGSAPTPSFDPSAQQPYGQQPIYDPSGGPGIPQPGAGAPFAMLQQPIVQDMALQYGQKLADQGKQLVETQFEKYVPVTRLKYYFAVDNNYVVRKLILLLFPFTHKVSLSAPSICIRS